MFPINVLGMSRDALVEFRKGLTAQLRRVDEVLKKTDPHGIQLTIRTTTEDPAHVAHVLDIAEQIVAASVGKGLEIHITEQAYAGATMWESKTIAELREQYQI